MSISYTCSLCGELHKGLPDLCFDAPYFYYDLPETERQHRCKLNSDFCTLDDEHFFVRGVLMIPIIGTSESFGWGAWTSLSRTNFDRYLDLFDREVRSDEGPYFGWFSNLLPDYPDTLQLKVCVHLQNNNMRPLLELEPTDHPLAVDQREGIPLERAIAIAERQLHPDTGDFF